MNKKELQEELNKMTKEMVKIYKRDGYLMPVIFLLTQFSNGKKGLGAIPLLPEMLPHRFELLRRLGNHARTDPHIKDVEALFMVSEMFLGSPQKKRQKAIMPSQDPNKKDGVIIAGMTQKGEQIINIFEVIKRKWRRKCLKKIEMKGKPENALLKEFWKTYRQVQTI